MELPDEQELFDERAAIAEFDGGLSRAAADAQAEAYVAQHRHRCEVRYLLAMAASGSTAALEAHMADIAAKRGEPAARELREEMREQWRKGNRGHAGDWR